MKRRAVKPLRTAAASVELFILLTLAGIGAFFASPFIIWKEYRDGKRF